MLSKAWKPHHLHDFNPAGQSTEERIEGKDSTHAEGGTRKDPRHLSYL